MEEKRFPVTHTDEEWRKLLTPEQYDILRGHGTERPGPCALNYEERAGTFSCAGCGQDLFRSEAKFESGTGWPSFWEPISKKAVAEHADNTLFMRRVEVVMVGSHEQQALHLLTEGEVYDAESGRCCPLQVVDEHHHRSFPRGHRT